MILFISNVAGELVRTFFLNHQSPGKYSIVWDGRDDAGRERSNGVYYYSFEIRQRGEQAEKVQGRYWLDNHHTICRYAMIVFNPRIGR